MTHPFSELLDLLGRRPDEMIPICSKGPEDTAPMMVDWVTVADAPGLCDELSGSRHVWFGVQPVSRPAESGKRGASKDVTGLVALYCDLDFADGKEQRGDISVGIDRGDAFEFINDLASVIGAQPHCVVQSGWGLQPYWLIRSLENGGRVDPVDGAILLLHWKQVVARLAKQWGIKLDPGVYDLPRILRVPGPPNIKRGQSVATGLFRVRKDPPLWLDFVTSQLNDYLGKDGTAPGLGEELRVRTATSGSEAYGGPRVFTDAEALEFLEEHAWKPARETPWGNGDDYWKVLWQCALACSHFTDMFDEEDLKDRLRAELRAGHGADPDANDETQIALGFLKGGDWLARRPGEEETKNPFAHGGRYYDGPIGLAPVFLAPVRTKAEKKVEAERREGTETEFPEPIVDEFWASRPVLTHIKQAALASTTSPEAVLALVLTDALGHSMPHVGLPKVGERPGRERPGVSSLNLLTCIVGPPGTGKDEAVTTATDCVKFITPRPPVVDTIGSGEGIAGTYVGRRAQSELTPKKLELCQHEWLFRAMVSESDTMAQLAARAGNTLLPEIRKAAMGQRLGFKNADKTRCYPVEGGTYRFVAVVLAQPTKMAWLFDDDEGGTPQRFLYAFAGNLDVPEDELEWPGCRAISMTPAILPPAWIDPGYVRFPPGLTQEPLKLTVCDEAKRIVRENRVRGQRMEALSDEAHTTLTRLKVAAALAFIDGRAEIGSDDWALSGHVMAHSRAVRIWVEGELAKKAAIISAKMGKAKGHQDLEAKMTVAAGTAAATDAAAERMLAHLRDAGESGMTWGLVLNKQRTVPSDVMDRARAELEVAGRIKIEEVGMHRGKPVLKITATDDAK